MTEQETTTATVPITVNIDVDALLKAHLGYRVAKPGTYNGDPDDWDDEEVYYGDGQIMDIVADKLAARVENDIREAVRAAVKDAALDKVDRIIDEVMDQEIQLTSSYGEPKAEPTTLRAAMIKAMTDRLEESVDEHGKRFTSDIYRANRGAPYLTWRASQVAKEVLDTELNNRLAQAVKDIRSAATDLVSQKIAAALRKVL